MTEAEIALEIEAILEEEEFQHDVMFFVFCTMYNVQFCTMQL